MDISALQEFVTLARHMNFARAAQELNFSQSALSTHIKALEAEVGALLIDRRGGSSLTKEGELFLAGAHTILDSYHKTMAAIRVMSTPPRTKCA